jgi:hypothetical protein
MVLLNFIYFCHLHRNYRLNVGGEFGDNSCSLLISPAQLTPGVEFKQKFQLASKTSRYKNQLVPQIFY